jgi:hypothetical protein
MKVKELIKELQEYHDQDNDVWIYNMESTDRVLVESVDLSQEECVEINVLDMDLKPEEDKNLQTYDLCTAINAFKGDYPVYVAHPLTPDADEHDERLNSLAEIANWDGHLFVIKFGKDDQEKQS